MAGLKLRGIRPDRVISGSLRRQLDTAGPLASASGVQAETDRRWDEYEDRDILAHHSAVPAGLERHAGDAPLSSREFQEILNEALRAWIHAGESSPCEERWPAFQGRITAAMTELAADLDSGQVAAVISSGGVIAALTASLLGLEPVALVTFNHVSINTGITKLAVGRGGTTVISCNEHAHLEEARPSLLSYR